MNGTKVWVVVVDCRSDLFYNSHFPLPLFSFLEGRGKRGVAGKNQGFTLRIIHIRSFII